VVRKTAPSKKIEDLKSQIKSMSKANELYEKQVSHIEEGNIKI